MPWEDSLQDSSQVLKLEDGIEEILPKREQHLVTTAEFEDIRARVQAISSLRKQAEKPGPTLRKRPTADQTSSETAGRGENENRSHEKLPVLRRRN